MRTIEQPIIALQHGRATKSAGGKVVYLGGMRAVFGGLVRVSPRVFGEKWLLLQVRRQGLDEISGKSATTVGSSTKLMPEMPHAGEHHRQPGCVGGGDDFGVAH